MDGGTLIFDRDQDGLTLHSEYILLLKDGRLEIGTEEEPYLNRANIMMHGHVRCIELPVFGCKVISRVNENKNQTILSPIKIGAHYMGLGVVTALLPLVKVLWGGTFPSLPDDAHRLQYKNNF